MTRIKDLKNHIDQEVEIAGWVYNFRSSGKISFLQIRDGSGFIQAIIVKSEVNEKVWQDIEKMTIETSVKIKGTVTEHPKQPGIFELQVKDLELVQVAEDYPIGKKEHGIDFLLDNRHLWLRSSKQIAIQKIRNAVIRAINNFYQEQNFIKIDTPIITPNACEGTTTLFELDYFDLGKAYLSQSGQLYLEAAIFAHGRVFDFSPTFRAEKSKTRRHITEFWMTNAEMAFAGQEENIKMQENLVCHIVKKVLAENLEELEILERDIEPLKKIKAPFERLDYMQAIKKLQELGSNIKDGDDLGNDDETILTKEYSKPIFVENYPSAVKAFYMKRMGGDDKYALCDDLLAPEGYGEIIGGSVREDDYNILLKRIKEHNLPIEDFNWYLDLRKYGSVPHAGFGMGLERVITWVCGLKHVRETIPFPRLITRLKP